MNKEKFIVFSGPMIKAIDNTKPGVWPAEPINPSLGFKSKTRRVIKAEFEPLSTSEVLVAEYGWLKRYHRGALMIWESEKICKTPYKEGDILWVKETFTKTKEGNFIYRADPMFDNCKKGDISWSWTSPWYMPRVASRYLIEIKSVKVERVQQITNEDAKKEGVTSTANGKCNHTSTIYKNPPCPKGCNCFNARENFAGLWDKINKKRGYGWDKNPRIYVYEFMRLE